MDFSKVDKVAMFKQIEQRMVTLYEKKNKDYGDSFGKSFQKYGLLGVCQRLEDKLNRMYSLAIQSKSPQDILSVAQVKDESVMDTLIDLANYSVMALIELELLKSQK